ncbi:hypothetical protein PHYBLDRAFT_153557 [Phycomyces blakesleeanus NRRL 1555(-)]|uniref:Uncharacterized protein n=1 Tax=Phycomyces blakesleeanus (strain ATCC 8743b / DSM 1359 / FGSC 10004 / NBRC 33097 / NRRL 1555) TaxID=763407 RepID=A0A162T9R8_PHYB8|nr:hypothetical protein PHYBLDRAFT_153557 [Phycomyces blakesleeanus NRRL 1555(-)]OAD65313.1 hypothetical protein PHYBLDRAFT_153557 [Phycomyces blakesleeanus NRRL 1555(-)]|eukprot:XP_018283353.1 hypothetical protein PHYBLDRAFT_153557 [Phycomyces blakesleeanus NRRL 1555(-)]
MPDKKQTLCQLSQEGTALSLKHLIYMVPQFIFDESTYKVYLSINIFMQNDPSVTKNAPPIAKSSAVLVLAQSDNITPSAFSIPMVNLQIGNMQGLPTELTSFLTTLQAQIMHVQNRTDQLERLAAENAR